MEQPKTAYEVIQKAYETQPYLKLAVDAKHQNVGAWSEKDGCYVIVACLAITGQWVGMTHELLINGERMVRDWTPVEKAAA